LAEIVVLDASALIALLSSDDPHHDWAVRMFLDTVAWQFQMTVLNQAEAMIHPTKAGKLKQFHAAVDRLRIEIVPVESSDGAQLAKIRADTNLRMPDVLVLHQALKVDGAIATTDKVLAEAARARSVGAFAPN
jgi:predicted nucleic acid-binding protein